MVANDLICYMYMHLILYASLMCTVLPCFFGDVVVLNYVALDHEGTSYCQIMDGICLLISHSSLMSKACMLCTTWAGAGGYHLG